MKIGHMKSMLNHVIMVALVKQNDFSQTNVANVIMTSQPAISKKIRILEAHLGFEIFARNGKSIIGLTKKGDDVCRLAENILENAIEIERLKM